MSESIHVPVMTEEIIRLLRPQADGLYVDGTLGGGGHAVALLEASAPNGRVLSFDLDPKAISRGRAELSSYGTRWSGIEENFRNIREAAEAHGFSPCDGVLLDLGISSDQLLDPRKGLSFQEDGPLDMRLGPRANEDGLTASDIVNTWSRDEIEKLLRVFGEERFAARIADAITRARSSSRITRSLELSTIVRNAVPERFRRGRINPATKTFQALRIAVNDELETLKQAIEGAKSILKERGRIAILSFHSLEDRIVKNAFRYTPDLTAITKKPLIPSDDEIQKNPRSRSAKLRVAEKRAPADIGDQPDQQHVTNHRTTYDAPS